MDRKICIIWTVGSIYRSVFQKILENWTNESHSPTPLDSDASDLKLIGMNVVGPPPSDDAPVPPMDCTVHIKLSIPENMDRAAHI